MNNKHDLHPAHTDPFDAVEHIMDTQGISAAEAYEQAGVPMPDASQFTADSLLKGIAARRQRETDAAYYEQEFKLSGIMTPEQAIAQQAINARNQHLWKKGT